MGLAISIGMIEQMGRLDAEGAEYFTRAFERVNQALTRRGLPTWEEPTQLNARRRRGVGSFPYAFLHYLRRAYVIRHDHPGQVIPPVGPEGLQATAERVEDATLMFDSHLLCHSDAEGFYVPVPFPEPLFADPDEHLPGGMVGSSHSLLRELRLLAPALGIDLDPDGDLSDEDALRLVTTSDAEQHPLWREHLVWFALFESARLSILHSTAIVFG